MRPRFATALLLLALTFPAPAQEEAVKPVSRSEIDLARSAILDGLPDVAVRKLRVLHEAGELDAEGGILYVEALVRAGQAEPALEILGEKGDGYWRGVALAGCGRFPEAIAALEEVLALEKHEHWGEAAISCSSLLASLGRMDEAENRLEQLLGREDAGRAEEARIRLAEIHLGSGDGEGARAILEGLEGEWREGLRDAAAITSARASLLLGDHHRAGETLQPLLKKETGLTLLEHLLVRLGMADALHGLEKTEKAKEILIELVERSPDLPYLDRAFARFDEYGMIDDPVLGERLKIWGGEPGGGERTALARFALAAVARQEGDLDAALVAFRAVLEGFRSNRWIARRSLLEMAEIHALAGRVGEARVCLEEAGPSVVFLPAVQARISHVMGLIDYAEGNFEGAAGSFAKAGEYSRARVNRITSAVNSALAAVRSEDEKAFQRAAVGLTDQGVPASVMAQVELERGIVAAANRRPEAQDLLLGFLENHPAHPRAAEAQLVLAETHLLLDFPAFPQAAEEDLNKATELGLTTPDLQQRAEYIAVGIARARGEDGDLAGAASAFLNHWPDSVHANRVRMILAEVYDRNQDYPNAQTQFEILAESLGDDPQAENALFFAGRAAMSLFNPEGLDRAVEIFGRVIEKEGVLAPQARLYQAKAKRRGGREEEALPILEVLIQSEADPTIRRAAMIEKAEALVVLAGEDPVLFEAAEGVARHLREEFPDLGSRLHATYLIARIRERVGDIEGGIEICYEGLAVDDLVLRELEDPAVLNWLYRLGFTSLGFLEQLGRHEAAVQIAERLAQTRGDRAEEARQRAEKLRLQHFIWEKKGL